MIGAGPAQRDQRLPDVTGRKHAELVAKHAGRAAVVSHGYDGGQTHRKLLESGKQRKLSGSAADGDNRLHNRLESRARRGMTIDFIIDWNPALAAG